MRLIPLAGFDESLRPLSPTRLARREHIKAVMRRAAEAAREGGKAMGEIAIACACAAPVSVAYVFFLMSR